MGIWDSGIAGSTRCRSGGSWQPSWMCSGNEKSGIKSVKNEFAQLNKYI